MTNMKVLIRRTWGNQNSCIQNWPSAARSWIAAGAQGIHSVLGPQLITVFCGLLMRDYGHSSIIKKKKI